MKIREIFSHVQTKLRRFISFAKSRNVILKDGIELSQCVGNQRYTSMKVIGPLDLMTDDIDAIEKVKMRRKSSIEIVMRRRSHSQVDSKIMRKPRVFSIASITEGVAQLKKKIVEHEGSTSICIDKGEPRRPEKTKVDHIDDRTLQFGSLLHVKLNPFNVQR